PPLWSSADLRRRQRRLLPSSELAEVHGLRYGRRVSAPDERPVDAFEERVLLDLGGAPPRRDPLVGVLHQEAADEVPRDAARRRREPAGVREPERLLDDVAERGAVGGPLERRHAVQQLVEEDAERPPVDGAAVAFPADDLRRQVLVRADERHGPGVRRLRVELQRRAVVEAEVRLGRLAVPLGEDPREERRRRDAAHAHALAVAGADEAPHDAVGARVHRRRLHQHRAHGAPQRQVEVGQHDVTVVPDQHVLRLQVSVHNAKHVQVLQRKQHLRGVKPCSLLIEMLAGLLLPERMKVAAAAILHDKAVELVGLEMGVQCGQEGMIKKAQYLPLGLCPDQLVPADERLLVHHFHREECVGVPQLHEVHAADVSVAESLEKPEVDKVEGGVPRVGQPDGLPPAVASGVPLHLTGAAA
uniref:Uncharacterized protein n=1 Tax=Oryza brachyantha TaxID=4533 RepID=J3KY12_ORYBR